MVLAHVMVLAPVFILAVSPYYGLSVSYADNLYYSVRRVIVLSVIFSAVNLCYIVSPCFGVGQHDGVIC